MNKSIALRIRYVEIYGFTMRSSLIWSISTEEHAELKFKVVQKQKNRSTNQNINYNVSRTYTYCRMNQNRSAVSLQRFHMLFSWASLFAIFIYSFLS